MSAIVLDGEAVAARVRAEVAERTAKLAAEGVQVGLGTILVGDDVPSARYVAMKHEDCREVGIASFHEHLPATATQSEVEDAVARFNANPAIHAFLVQVPLPPGLNEERALLAVEPDKDVDGLQPVNLGRLVMGTPGPLPCTPAGILELLHAYDVPVEGRHVVVIGRGLTIGRPLALLVGPEASRVQRRGDGGPHRGPGHGRVRPPGRHRGGRGRLGRPGDRGHGEARRGGGRGRDQLVGPQAVVRRRPGSGRGGRVDHPPPGWSRADDQGDAVAQRTGRGRAVLSGGRRAAGRRHRG